MTCRRVTAADGVNEGQAHGHLLDESAQTHLDTVHGSAERLLALLKDLLVLSRLRPPEREDVREVSVGEIIVPVFAMKARSPSL